MVNQKIKKIVHEIETDPKLKVMGNLVIVGLNQACESKLEDAWLCSADGVLSPLPWATYSTDDQANSAEVMLSDGGDAVVTFHESRPNSRDHRPNGIRIHHEELEVPYVVFANVGEERLTVDGEWVEPGAWMTVRERSIDDSEVQDALWNFLQSPEVQKEIEAARRGDRA